MHPKYRHPFIDGMQMVPEHRKKELQKIRTWISTQPHLPHFSDEYIYLFLHAAYWHVDKTKSYIESYCTIRASAPAIFSDRDLTSAKMQVVRTLAYLARLPKLTPDGYRVLMYVIKDPDPTKMNFNDAVKGFCMYNDCILSEEGLRDGYVVVFDMKKVCIGHLARVSLPTVRAIMFYIQEAHPCRLKAVHVLNTPPWIHHIMRIILPLVKSELLSIVKFHKGELPEGLPQEILPAEYGGEAPSLGELDREVDLYQEKYAEWLLDSEFFKADESKRVKKTTWWGLFSGSNSTEKLDEKTILKNLQVD